MVNGRSPSEARSVAVPGGEGAARGSIPSEGEASHGHRHSAMIASVEGAVQVRTPSAVRTL
eukprot:10092767-Alexandrium_andersonii.AAC.1